MSISEKLNNFISNKNSHAFLLYGPWGVGKTFSLEQWIRMENLDKEYTVIPLSLFGISSTNELNSLALNSEGFFNKFIKRVKSLNQDIAVGVGPISVSLPLIGVVSSLLNEKHNKRGKYLFVLDDIERKDNKLSIEEILGFVDSLPHDNTKVILVANLEKMENSAAFNGFKEKVIQDDFHLSNPEREAVESIIGKEYVTPLFNNPYPIKNLRTLIKVRDILEKTNPKTNNLVFFNCIYYCCLNIFENQLGKTELSENYKIEEIKSLNLISTFKHAPSEEEKNKIIQNIDNHVSKIQNNWEYVYENVKIKNLLNEINENYLMSFVRDVYESIYNEDYERLEKIEPILKKEPLKTFGEAGMSVFLSANPKKKYQQILTNYLNFFNSNDYELLNLFKNYCYTIKFCHNLISTNTKLKSLEKKINDICIKRLPQYIFENTFSIPDANLNSFFDAEDGDSLDWLKKLEEKVLNSYYEVFNSNYILDSKSSKINFRELKQKIQSATDVFNGMAKFDIFRLDFDTISLNILSFITKKISGDVCDEDWKYLLSFTDWMKENLNKKICLVKSVNFIHQKISSKSIVGKRFLFVEKLYSILKEYGSLQKK